MHIVTRMQVSIRAPCCGKWFDCAKCHEEQCDHELKRSNTLVGLGKEFLNRFLAARSANMFSERICCMPSFVVAT